MGLDSQCTKFAIVINLPSDRKMLNLSELLKVSLSELFTEWSFILHDKDFLDNGVRKTLHYHVIGRTAKRVRIATIINKLSYLLGIDTLCIQCKKCLSYVGAIQYLVHKNDKDKFQYDVAAIVSSLHQDDLELIIASDNDNITIDRLYYTIKHAKSLYDVMREIGLSAYLGYRNVIKDLWGERDII